MFKISTTEGKELAIVEEVRYIKINERNGCFNQCDKKDAIGIALNGKPYNLFNHNSILDASTVIVREIDGGLEIHNEKEKAVVLEQQLAEADEAAIELYEASLIYEEINAEQDEAIIQIYEMMEEITNG